MESYLYLSSLREFMRFKRTVIWIVMGLVGLLLGSLWHRLSESSTPTDQYTTVTGILTFHVLALASAIFTSAVVSQEVEQKTIVYLLTRPVARWKILLFRFLASVTAVAILSIFGVLCVSFGVYGNKLFSNALLLNDLLAVLFGAFAYGALFLLLSLLLNRSMIVCLLFAFGWETSVPRMPGEMYRLSIYSHLEAISQHPGLSTDSGSPIANIISGGLGSNIIAPSTAYAILVILTVSLAAVSMMWFSRFEYVPREDAE